MNAPPVVELRQSFFAKDRAAWRRWLQKNHEATREVWLLFYKKHTNKPCVSLAEAVEEALCFGWIDGKLRRVDDEKHLLRFSPRRPNSVWSPTNIARVRRLTREGRMTTPGLKAVEEAKKRGRWGSGSLPRQDTAVPTDLMAALRRRRRALAFFEGLAPSYRKMYIGWVLDAKRAETRARRVRVVVDRAARGLRPGIDM